MWLRLRPSSGCFTQVARWRQAGRNCPHICSCNCIFLQLCQLYSIFKVFSFFMFFYRIYHAVDFYKPPNYRYQVSAATFQSWFFCFQIIMQKWMRFALISLCNGQRTLHGGKRRKMPRKSHSSHIIGQTVFFQCGGLSILVGTSMNQRLKKPTSSLDGFVAILWATRLNKDVRTFPLFLSKTLTFPEKK